MRIFVAGPWGDFSDASPEVIERNIQIADSVGKWLVLTGHEAYIPHTMCRTWSGRFTKQQMKRLDNSFLDQWAQAIVRIPGASTGADEEVQRAISNGLEIMELSAAAGRFVLLHARLLQLEEEPPL